jgi:DnaJ like chaperone protein
VRRPGRFDRIGEIDAVSVWGKILGGAAGFALGGPLGAIIGAAAGHAFDRAAGAREGVIGQASRQAAFSVAVIVLGAKMAKADGHVSREEIRAFRQVFHVPPGEVARVGRIFNAARSDPHGFEPYARQVATLFADRPAVLKELLDALFHIAKADGVISPEEVAFLRGVAQIFRFDAETFESILAGHSGPDHGDPYEVLGVPRDASDARVKATYRQLIRETHPDLLIAQGMPQEFIDVANDRLATINVAYDRIRNERGLT